MSSKKVLIAYASAHGSTAEVAQFIGKILEERGLTVTVAPVQSVGSTDEYEFVVLGTAAHSGTWLPDMTSFVTRFQDSLAQKPVFFWVSCIRVLEQHGYEHVLEYYMVHELYQKLNVIDSTVLAGKLDLTSVDWNERWTLSARYDGSTWPSNFDGDFRDWDKIRAWATQIADRILAEEATYKQE